MKWLIYNTLFAIGYALMLPRFFVRMWRRGGYLRDFLQRVGIYRAEVLQRLRERRRIWVHAVSVGEVAVALRFMEEVRRTDPPAAFVLSTTTSTGHRIAESKLGSSDVLIYFPSDFPVVVSRVLKILDPEALVLTEGELWPNLIRKAKARGIPVMLINGRVSGKSFAGYRKVRAFFAPVLGIMDLIVAQSEADRDRFVALGADPGRVKVLGSAKYDVARADAAGAAEARKLLAAAGIGEGARILVGGSTWPGEEAALCAIYKRLRESFDDLRLVLVPRHAERRSKVEEDIRKQGLTWLRRSAMGPDGTGAGGAPVKPVDVLLVDTTGELIRFYACAAVIFVGKSLCSRGGQNMIEPAMLGKAVIVGPHMENFEAVIADFLAAEAAVQVRDVAGLEASLRQLLADEGRRQEYGRRAQKVVEAKRGSVRDTVALFMGVARGR